METPRTVVWTKTTYLEMHSPPAGPLAPHRPEAHIERLERPTVDAYRFLYNSVGRDHHWVDRNLMADEELRRILQDERVEIYVLTVSGKPAGYAELDRRQPGEIELAYFGLFPAYMGQGLGKYFLEWVVALAWSYDPQRVWVHTCDLDHPAALPCYRKAGFKMYDEQFVEQPIVVPPRPSR